MPAPARRVTGVVATVGALLGLALTVVGLWSAVRVGPSGRAQFSATSTAAGPVKIEPCVVNAVDATVEVTATRSDGGPVWVGVASSSDADALLGNARRLSATGVQFPSGSLRLHTIGSQPSSALATADVWRDASAAARSAGLVVHQSGRPEAVVVASGDASALGRVTTTVTWLNRAWFAEALAVTLLGLLLTGGSLGHLRQRRRTARAGVAGDEADQGNPAHVRAGERENA